MTLVISAAGMAAIDFASVANVRQTLPVFAPKHFCYCVDPLKSLLCRSRLATRSKFRLSPDT